MTSDEIRVAFADRKWFSQLEVETAAHLADISQTLKALLTRLENQCALAPTEEQNIPVN